jgi:precorrin-6x reductase
LVVFNEVQLYPLRIYRYYQVQLSTNLQIFSSCVAAIVSGGKGTAQDKIKALREAGVTVVESPAKIGSTMFEIFKQRGMVE